MNRAILLLLGSVVVLAGLVFALSRGKPAGEELTVFCAAGLREPMEAVRAAYERQHGVKINVHYGGSSTLLANLRLKSEADVFLPADESYMDAALAEGMVSSARLVASMRPILAVKKAEESKNRRTQEPKNQTERKSLKSVDEVLEKQVRISMTDPAAAATGKLVKEALEKAGKWEAFRARVTVFKGNVSEVAADLEIGAVDAAVIWDAMLKQLSGLEELPLAELVDVKARVAVGVVADAKHRAEAERFETFLSSIQGQRFFIDAGFSPGPSSR